MNASIDCTSPAIDAARSLLVALVDALPDATLLVSRDCAWVEHMNAAAMTLLSRSEGDAKTGLRLSELFVGGVEAGQWTEVCVPHHGSACSHVLARAEKGPEGLLVVSLRAARSAGSPAVRHDIRNRLAHDLRTPLSSILGFSELLSVSGPAASEQERTLYTDCLTAGAKHLSQLIDDLVDAGCLARGRLHLQRSLVRVGEIVREAAQVMRHAARLAKVTLEIAGSREDLQATLDPARLLQVLCNFLAAAIKHSQPGGRIVISFSQEFPDRLTLAVSPRGFAGERLTYSAFVHEALERAVDPDLPGEAAALALETSRRIIERQGGRVGISSDACGEVLFAELPVNVAGLGALRWIQLEEVG